MILRRLSLAAAFVSLSSWASPAQVPDSQSTTGRVGQYFSYSIEYSGTNVDVDLDGRLPPGLSFDGDRITGYPEESGTYNLDVEVENREGDDEGDLRIRIIPTEATLVNGTLAAGTQGAPFYLELYAYGDRPIIYTLTGDIPPGLSFDPETRVLNGVPTQAGSFVVTATAENSLGGTSKEIHIVIRAPLDSDADGIPDDMEVAQGSDPNNASSSVLGGSSPLVDRLGLYDASLRLNFLKPGKDVVKILGFVDVPENFNFAGQRVTVSIGGKAYDFALGRNGVARIKGGDSVRVKVGPKKRGIVQAGTRALLISLKRADLAAALIDENIVPGDKIYREERLVNLTVYFNGKLYVADPLFYYNANDFRSGRAGTAYDDYFLDQAIKYYF